MSYKRTRTATVAAVMTLGTGLLLALPSSLQASAADTPSAVNTIPILPQVPSTPLYDIGVQNAISNAPIAAPTTTPTLFTAKVVDGTSTFTYSMVGKNPAVATTNGLTTVNTELVPVIVKFSNGDTWNATVADGCDTGASALTRTKNSPIFVSQAWHFGLVSIGTGQVTDAFQRAEFWKYANPLYGVNPTYGVNLALTTLAPVTINVPTADSALFTAPCGNKLLGAVNESWLQNYLQGTVIPSLTSKGVGATTFPIFLLHNVVAYVGTTSVCCVLGYHAAYSPSAGEIQTYAIADYDNSADFTGDSDITALSHEVGEWMNDPIGNNPTKPWGHIGQVSGCQSNLEVGDPLSGTNFADTVSSFTYHPQELAFFSWFYHQKPSWGANGWYSDKGTFKTSAAACS
jgi:hypothetical protein